MNWSRGLLRAWMVFTVAWLIGVGVKTYNEWPRRDPWDGFPPGTTLSLDDLPSMPVPTEHRYVGPFSYVGAKDGAPRQHIVQAPDGSKHIIEAPEGATPDQITAFAAKVVPAPPDTSHWHPKHL
jgi:hypothetical protein